MYLFAGELSPLAVSIVCVCHMWSFIVNVYHVNVQVECNMLVLNQLEGGKVEVMQCDTQEVRTQEWMSFT